MTEQFVVHNDKVYVIKELYDKDVMKVNEENKYLHSIIKEVREYIESHKNMTQGSFNGKEWVEQYFELVCDPKELLKILDKESINEENK